MTAPAAISGDFATYRHVQGRKVLQLVIEVPAELAASVFAALGTPGTGEGIPVALARLHSPAEPIAKPDAPKERRPFSELPYSQQAALRCREPEFWKYLDHSTEVPFPTDDETRAAAVVRALCEVESRSQLNTDEYARRQWEDLDAAYFAWSRGMR